MPIKTPHFALEAFIAGDQYSASVDKRRMLAIDNHMGFLSDLIGPGIIDGWEMSAASVLLLKVSPGWGIIDRNVTRTFGDYYRSLQDNNNVYVWMRRRAGVVGQTSAFSDIESVSFIDTTPPTTPSALTLQSRTFETVSISWTAGSDIDFAKFKVYRSSNNIDYSAIAETVSASYVDSDLDSNTLYYYKTSALDITGNESSLSSALAVTTLSDNSPPADPTSVEITVSKSALLLTWKPSPFGIVSVYRVYVTPVTIEGISSGMTFVRETSSQKRDISLVGLTDGQKYRVVVKAVGTNTFESDGVIKHGIPDNLAGPYDVEDIDISDSPGDGVLSNISLDISWTPYIDPYDDSVAVSYEIQLQEFDGNSGAIISEWIAVPEGFSKSFKVYPYTDSSGSIVYKSISDRKDYTVILRAIDAAGIRSVGKKAFYKTRSFESPTPPTLLTVSQSADKSLVYAWYNSSQTFAGNLVTIERTCSSITTTLVSRQDVGRATSYILSSSNVSSSCEYTLKIVAVDEFGNESEEQSVSFALPDLDSLPRPPVPTKQFVLSGDREATIVWNPANIDYVQSYRVYRAEEAVSYMASDFSRVETLSSSSSSYTDYGLDNTKVYIYFVTTVDIFGKESLNPVDDEYFDYALLVATPISRGDLPYPSNLTISSVSRNVLLNWDITGGTHDGHEVFRSKSNTYSFEKIANLPASASSYTDYDVLLETDDYYYIVRKFRNEADLFVTESSSSVSGAILLGRVRTLNGVMTFDTSGSRNIKDLEDPIREETQARLAAHRHTYNSEDDDRRINLGDMLTVADWTTTDYFRYFTSTDISQTTTYNVYLNGKRAESYNVFFTLDRDSGVLTFERQLALGDTLSDPDAVYLFTDPPFVSVDFDNLSEVQNQLPKERLEGASAQQVNVGLIDDIQLPVNNHEGRIGEALLPVTVATIAVDDGYRYAPVTDESIGDAVVWYDILHADAFDENILVAGTSDGIYTSPDFGLTWNRQFETPTPVVKLFYSTFHNYYIALTNRGVYGSGGGTQGGFSVWQELKGMENSKVARDIAEDGIGNVFCTCDLGVFKLIKDVGRGSFFWQQTPIFGPRSTESFAICYDSVRSRFIASNELGIFVTTNNGERWDFSDEMPEQKPFYAFAQNGSTIFGITKDSVWRLKTDSSIFSRVARLDVSLCRKIEIWKNRVYVTTNKGVYVSAADDSTLTFDNWESISTKWPDMVQIWDLEASIESDEQIYFIRAFSHMVSGHYSLPSSSLNVLDDRLFIGTEERLYISEAHSRLALQSEIAGSVVPTVYVNGIEQIIGYRFSTSEDRLRQNICFDEKLKPSDVVTFANQYKNFVSPHGGWADCDFGAKILVKIDGSKINLGSIAEKPATAIAALRWPSYTDVNAHKAGADKAFETVQSSQTSLLALSVDDPKRLISFDKPHVNSFLFAVEKFMSQLYPETRIVQSVDSSGNLIFTDASGNVVTSTTPGAIPKYEAFKIPNFTVALVSYDEEFRSFGLEDYGRYNQKYTGADGLGSFGTDLDTNGSSGGTVGFSYDVQSPLEKIKFSKGWPEQFYDGKVSTYITDFRGTDPIEGFGISRYSKSFGGVVGDSFDDDYGTYFVVALANSIDGTFAFNSPLKKRNRLQVDITNPNFSNTELPHWVVEDTFEWVNSGAPSHLSQVIHSNIDYMGVALQRSNPLVIDQNCPPYQAKFITPCIYDWYDKFNSTVDYKIHTSFGHAGKQLQYPNALLYVKDINQVLVGGYGGLIAINAADYTILPIDVDSRKNLFIKDLYMNGVQVYILDENALYVWDLLSGNITKDRGLGLPDKLYKVSVMLTGNLIICGEDGIYAKRAAQEEWQKVVSTSGAVEILATPDAAFAVDVSGDIWYSTEGFFWSKIGNSGDLTINQIVKHRAQIFVATNRGVYSDYGSFYSGSASLSLIDIFDDIEESANVCVNSLSSNSNEAIFGLSDGRYILMSSLFYVHDDTLLDTIHKTLTVDGDLWLFGFDNFKIVSENLVRRLATGSSVL